jgi:hypothetical protein
MTSFQRKVEALNCGKKMRKGDPYGHEGSPLH